MRPTSRTTDAQKKADQADTAISDAQKKAGRADADAKQAASDKSGRRGRS